MRQPARREFVAGPAGRIECAVDAAQGAARGIALVAHPHPLFGGSLDNKVAQTLARSLAELGYCVHAAARLGYLTEAQRDALDVKVKQTSAALNGYIRSMSAREL